MKRMDKCCLPKLSVYGKRTVEDVFDEEVFPTLNFYVRWGMKHRVLNVTLVSAALMVFTWFLFNGFYLMVFI